ncbi:MAG: phage tail tip lysozyme [Candidatus Saccharibacteria bacterium]
MARFFIFLFIPILLVTNLQLPGVSADYAPPPLTPAQLESIRANTAFYDPTDISSCNADGSSTAASSLTGSKGAEQVYNFLISKGLKNFQAAGFMGNLQGESGFNPRRVQSTPTPGGDKDTMAVDGKTGYGIVQWTDLGRQQGLHAAAVKAGTIDGDMTTQLDYMWTELSGGYKSSTLDPLLKSTTVEEATDIVMRHYETPADMIAALVLRSGYAKTLLQTYGSSSPVAAASSSAQKPTIVLDPGHSGTDVTQIDATTGLHMHDYPNQFESDEVFAIAQTVKAKLLTDGYNVLMTKQAVSDTVLFRARATIANQANAALAVSIHDDHSQPWNSFGQVYTQKVGLYRTGTKGKISFSDQAVATKSQAYGAIFTAQRTATEGHPVTSTDVNFAGRAGIDPGNISQVQLMATVPWVYNEVGAPAGKSLSQADQDKYAQGLINSIEKAVPSDSAQTTVDGNPCATGSSSSSATGAIQGNIVQTALNLAWDTTGHGLNKADAKPTYQVAEPKYNGSTGLNEFSDCGVFVSTVMIASGVDKSYPKRVTGTQQAYLESSKNYKQITTSSTAGLQPGDILVSTNHTYFFVGAQSGGYNSVGASLNSHVPQPSGSVYWTDYQGITFKIFRYIGSGA